MTPMQNGATGGGIIGLMSYGAATLIPDMPAEVSSALLALIIALWGWLVPAKR